MRKDILKVIVLVCIFVVQMIMTTLVQAQPNGCPTDMVHYWKMDESSQPYTDFYGANNATCTNCPAATTGIVNGAQQFNLTAQVNVADDNTFDWSVTDSFSIEFWMKTDSSSTCSGNQVIMGRTNPFWWVGCVNNTGVAYFELNDTSGYGTAIEGSTDLTDGNWHHVVAVRDSSRIRLYIDGVQEGIANIAYSSGFDSATALLNIGWLNFGGGFHFVGTVDEIALYNRALSEGEIQGHYYLARGYCDMCASPIRIMPLGDSITYGRNDPALEPNEQATPNYVVGYRQSLYLSLWNAGYDVNFVGSLQDGELATPTFDVDHQGEAPVIGSFTAQDLAAEVYNFLSTSPPDVILLHIGTNNIVNTTPNDIANILDEIDRYSKNITVLLARIVNTKEASDPRHDIITQFNSDVAAMAMSRTVDKIILVDQEHALSYPSDMYDMLHPNATGYGKMANTWLNVLSDFLPMCSSAAPMITSNPVTIATVNQLYMYDVNATGNPFPAYSLMTAPSGMTIDQSTGLISWTPNAPGSFDVVVQASNTEGTDTQSFTIQVSICPADMVHYWKMDESSQPYTDFYGANNATCTNCPAATTGIVNGAQQFNLTAQVNVADDNTFDWSVTDSFSIEFWMKTDSSSTCSGNQVIMGRTNPFWWVGCVNNTGVAYFELNDTSGYGTAIEGSTDLTDGNWHHVVAVRDSSRIRLYIDGVQEGIANIAYSSGFDSATALLNIGWLNFGGGFHFVGTVDEIALYNRALSEGEIQGHYNNGSAGNGYCSSAYTISGSVSGGNGTISCTSPVSHGDTSTCTITANTGYHLSALTDNGSDVMSAVTGNNPYAYTITNVIANHTVVASFATNTYTLTVAKSGNGTGTVTSSPSGINCGSDCSEPYNTGTVVTLTATPDANSTFTWTGGGCSGTGLCVLTMNADTTATATFTLKQYTVTPSAGPNGSISPPTPQTVNHGSSIQFTITPNISYRVADVKVDGSSVGAVTSYTFNNITANHTIEATFIGMYSISGTVTSSGSTPISGVTMTLGGAGSGSTLTDASGNYSFSGLANGAYTVTPNKAGYKFNPVSRVVTISGGSVTGQNFAGTLTINRTYGISGTVTSGGSPLSGVTITLGGAGSGSTLTDASGNYGFSGLANGAYTVTPSLGGHTFTPTSRNVSVSGASVTGQNFTGTATGGTYSISGTVTSGGSPIQGVTISGSGGCSGFTTTNSNGDYTLAGIPDGSTCTVTPSKSAYTFTPTSRTVTINGANVTGQDFVGTPGAITYSISGNVKTPDKARPGSPISGVTMTLSGTGCSGSASTGSNGNYIFTGLSDGVTCTVTPSKAGYTFSPASRTVTINNANVTGQDFVRQ